MPQILVIYTFSNNVASGTSNSFVVFFWWSNDQPTQSNFIDFVTIATTGNAVDFGDLISSTTRECYLGII